MLYTIQNDLLAVTCSETGAELQAVQDRKLGDAHRLWQSGADSWKDRAPLLFPFCGRLKDNRFTENGVEYHCGIHGFAKDLPHTLLKQTGDSLAFTLHSSEETRCCYPWDFRIDTLYRLEGNRLIWTVDVYNPGPSKLPFSIGFHPGYAYPFSAGLSPEGYQLRFEQPESPTRLCHDENGNLTGKEIVLWNKEAVIPLDYPLLPESFILTGIRSEYVQLEERATGRYTRVYLGGAPNLTFWEKPGARHFVCMEPWFGAPDAANSNGCFWDKRDLIVLEPNESKRFPHIMEFGL